MISVQVQRFYALFIMTGRFNQNTRNFLMQKLHTVHSTYELHMKPQPGQTRLEKIRTVSVNPQSSPARSVLCVVCIILSF